MNDLQIFGVAAAVYVASRLVLGLALRFVKRRAGAAYGALESLLTPLQLVVVGASIEVGFRVADRDTRGPDALVAVLLAWLGLRAVIALLSEVYFRKIRRVILPDLLKKLIAGVLYLVLGLVLVHLFWNVSPADLILFTVIGLVVAGWLLQSLVANVTLGLSLMIQRKLRVGDLVRIGAVEGRVRELDWRSTQIITSENALVIVPNRVMAESICINFRGPHDPYRTRLSLTASSSSSPVAVKGAIADCVRDATDGVVEKPETEVSQGRSEGATIAYDVAFWSPSYEQSKALADRVLQHAWYRFRRDGFSPENAGEAFSPQGTRDLARASSRISNWLRDVPIFSGTSTEYLEMLSRGARVAIYGRGEFVFRQGDAGDALFVVRSGSVGIHLAGADVHVGTSAVGTIQAGGFFGERSLLTGEARSASAVAREDTELLVIDKSNMLTLLSADKDAALRISAIMTARKQANESISAWSSQEQDQIGFLTMIRRAFSLP